jgi:AraC-like DNA-binding protein
MSDKVVSEYLAGLGPDTVAGEVRQLLVDALDAGEPDVAAVAAELAMSPRTLQRRLGDEGTTFRDVLTDTRRGLADALLTAGDLSVTDVGLRLGFSETAAFSRAYRRWTGQSPSALREKGAARKN